jgi:hypothetical protein
MSLSPRKFLGVWWRVGALLLTPIARRIRLGWLLRSRRERPCCRRAAECGQQIPPSDG